MATVNETNDSIPLTLAEPSTFHRICELPERGWERLWLWASERLNPIVVKEVRQSLKSRQFSICFSLTLIAAVSWTLLAISLMVPRIYYAPGGLQLLTGFFFILAVPLMIIIPFSAFRSLTTETEDSTFELLSISALSAWQIVLGKMASACLQILLYLSALAPCIVLTYLLRGVTLSSILVVLGMTVVFSIGETAIALLLAAVARTRMLQSGAGVLLLAGLLIVFGFWGSLIVQGAITELGEIPREGLIFFFALGTVFAVALNLVLRAAAAAIDFASENHSTPLRKRILLLMAVVMFWSTFAVVATGEEEGAMALLIVSFCICLFIGALMTGELGVISPRARRTLPQTFLGRIMLTWFYPGAGMGYVFLCCMFAALYLTMCASEIYYSLNLQLRIGRSSLVVVGYLFVCYLVGYLGLNRLLIFGIARYMPARMLGAFALMTVLLLLTHIIPLVLAFYFNDYREFDYEWHQALNIIWTCNEAAQGLSVPIEVSLVILTLGSLTIFGLNLITCTRDVMLVRVAEPPRVQEEHSEAKPDVTPDPFAI